MTTTTPATRSPGTRGPQGGPPLPVPALAYGVLMITSVLLSAGSPRPGASPAAVLDYDRTHQTAELIGGCLGFAAALPLAIWAAIAYRRLRVLGVTAPGPLMGFAGGLLAAASLALTGLLNWTTANLSGGAGADLARALSDLGFATGSAGFVAPFGLLIAGIAVPGLILRLLPRWLCWAGLVIAVAAFLSTFALLTPALDVTFPIGRFLGLAWILAAGFLLPARRRPSR